MNSISSLFTMPNAWWGRNGVWLCEMERTPRIPVFFRFLFEYKRTKSTNFIDSQFPISNNLTHTEGLSLCSLLLTHDLNWPTENYVSRKWKWVVGTLPPMPLAVSMNMCCFSIWHVEDKVRFIGSKPLKSCHEIYNLYNKNQNWDSPHFHTLLNSL